MSSVVRGLKSSVSWLDLDYVDGTCCRHSVGEDDTI